MSPAVYTILLLALVGPAQTAKMPQPVPTLPGDGDLSWSVDEADFVAFGDCMTGLGLGTTDECATYDLDSDSDADLLDLALFQTAFTGAETLSVSVSSDADDGTELDDACWFDDGFFWTGHNYIGASDCGTYDAGLRFHLPQVRRGEKFAYARLVLPATGLGQVSSTAQLRITGVDQADPPEFSVARPSQLPKTDASAEWVMTSDWPSAAGDFDYSPLDRYSPDISSIINKIVEHTDWGSDPGHRTVALVIENHDSAPGNYLVFRDYEASDFRCEAPIAPRLELYRTVRSTFVGKELLGRPTDRSVTVRAMSLIPLEAYFEYGSVSGVFDRQTAVVAYAGGSSIEAVLDYLSPDTRYYYRMRFRQPNQPAFEAGPERSFHTQRTPGSSFTFAVQSDSHLHNYRNEPLRCSLYRCALKNMWAEAPDFLIDLGDTFNSESYSQRPWEGDSRWVRDDALDFEESLQRHLAQRPYLDLICHSTPFFFAIGNHEGEQGWRLDGTPDNVAVWATNARKTIYALPEPDSFYTGNQEDTPFCGLREDYYAWQWGEALFVVLDPFWYTARKPHSHAGSGSGDNWDWTLGQDQYGWLESTLQNSSAIFKFVFAHHVTGGVNTYGRGGIEAASYALARRGSFEWGGEDSCGQPAFDTQRPGWDSGPVHKLMVDNQVTIFFHGHDHAFARQELDGIIYQECPQPTDATYGIGCTPDGLYLHGDVVANSGHLRVTVSPSEVTVEYVRAYLPGDGPNGEVAYSYTVPAKR
jgi:hypothetical protein